MVGATVELLVRGNAATAVAAKERGAAGLHGCELAAPEADHAACVGGCGALWPSMRQRVDKGDGMPEGDEI